MKKIIQMIIALALLMVCFISLVACVSGSNGNGSHEPEVNTHFTRTYTSDMDFINDVKQYGISGSNATNIKANKSIKAFFNYRDINGFNQRLFDNVSASTMFTLYKFFESDLGAIYLIAIKVGSHYEPFLAHCGVLNKSDIANAIKTQLKNPESLQLHSATLYWRADFTERQKNESFDAIDIGIYADYSAQNGFGGYNRTYCSVSFSFFTSQFSYNGNTLNALSYATAISKYDYNKSIY